MKKFKKAISLIVLVITIIVLAILATAIIVSISNSNIMTEARKAVYKSDIQSLKEQYAVWIADKIVNEGIEDTSAINVPADSDEIDDIFDDLPDSIGEGGVAIEDGEIVVKTDDPEKEEVLDGEGIKHVPGFGVTGLRIKDSANNVIVLTKSNASLYYGAQISNYAAGGATYRIFYVDFDGKYGEANTIYLKADYDSTRVVGSTGYTEKSNATTLKVDQMNPLWATSRGTSTAATWNDNEKAAAYLCDTTKWTTYVDSTKAKFAIGSPSVEMYMDSYNSVTHSAGNNVLGYTFNSTNPGYEYKVDGVAASGMTENNTIDNVGYGCMYGLKAYDFIWLSSPISTGIADLGTIAGGEASNLYHFAWGTVDTGVICPIIALNSSFVPQIADVTITYDLTKCTSSNTSTSIRIGETYTTTLTAISGYTMEDVTVTIASNGTVIDNAYNTLTNVVTLTVTGDIVVTDKISAIPIILDASDEEIELTKANVKDYYGKEISNYTTNYATYRIFYVDFDGKFGPSGIVYLKADFSYGRNSTKLKTTKSQATTLKVDEMNPIWAAQRGTKTNATWDDEEEVMAYLCDTTKWTAYVDSTKADFAIGSPSVEMYVESYNQVPHTVGNNIFSLSLDTESYSSPGYLISVDGGKLDYATRGNTIDNVGYESMYCDNYWLASTSPLGIFGIDDECLNILVVDGAYGVCPVIALKPSFKAKLAE